MAQGVTVIATIALARMYGPIEFGVYGILAGVTAVGSLLTTGRYELAIPLAATDAEARDLVRLSMWAGLGSVLVITALVTVLLWTGSLDLLLTGNPVLAFLVPPWILSLNALSVIQMIHSRRENYRQIAMVRVASAVFVAIVAASLGLLEVHGGLVWGTTLGSGLAVAVCGWRLGGMRVRERATARRNGIREAARKYSSHPRHLAFGHAISALSQQLPILTAGAAFTRADAGFITVAQRFVGLPSKVLAQAVGEVFRARAARLHREGRSFERLMLKTIIGGLVLGVAPALGIYLLAPWAFAAVLGPDWVTAGDFARILVVAAYLQFALTPTDKWSLVLGRNGYGLLWQVVRVSLVGAVSVWAVALPTEPERYLAWIVAVSGLMYGIDATVGLGAVRRAER